MATYIKYLDFDRTWGVFGSNGNSIGVSLASWTCPSNEYITNITFDSLGTKPSGYNNYCQWILTTGGNTQSVWTFWICNGTTSPTLWIKSSQTITMRPSSSDPSIGVSNTDKSFNFNGRRLAGSAIYLYVEKPSGSSHNPVNFQLRGYNKVTITTAALGTKPSVTAGTTITKTQMDALKTWVDGTYTTYMINPTSVTQNAVISETVGDSYKPVNIGASITASWYNGQT